MKKGDRMILDDLSIVRVESARGTLVQIKHDEGSQAGEAYPEKVLRNRLTATIRRAKDTEIKAGAELYTPVNGRQMIKVQVTGIFSGSTVMVKDMIHGRTYNLRPQDLMVDVAAKIRGSR